MFGEIIDVIVLGFAIFGIISAIYRIMLRSLKADGKRKMFLVLPFTLGCKNCAGELYAARMRSNMTGGSSDVTVIALDCGATEKELLECRDLCRESEGIYLLKPQELYDFIKRTNL